MFRNHSSKKKATFQKKIYSTPHPKKPEDLPIYNAPQKILAKFQDIKVGCPAVPP